MIDKIDDFPGAVFAREQSELHLSIITQKEVTSYCQEIGRGIRRKIEAGQFSFDWGIPINLSSIALSNIDKYLLEKRYTTKIVVRDTLNEDGSISPHRYLIIGWKESK